MLKIRRGFLVILFALGLAWIVTGCVQQDIQNVDSRGKGIVCFGDSLTFGYGAEPGEDYPSNLAKMVCVPVLNAGIDGETTTEALRRLEADVLERQPFLVIVEYGGNDFLRKIPRQTTVKNLEEMIRRIQAKGAMVALVDVSAGMFLRDYRIAYRSLARKYGAVFVPSILDKIITDPKMKSDFLHPNAAGYAVIARRVYQAVAPYIQKDRRN